MTNLPRESHMMEKAMGTDCKASFVLAAFFLIQYNLTMWALTQDFDLHRPLPFSHSQLIR